MTETFPVVASAGSLRATEGVRFRHNWTEGGVTVRTAFTGAHLLHLATAACVLNDLYREAAEAGLDLAGVRVTASGGFDTATWASTGIHYTVELDSRAPQEDLDLLLARVDDVAEIPRALRAGPPVSRAG